MSWALLILLYTSLGLSISAQGLHSASQQLGRALSAPPSLQRRGLQQACGDVSNCLPGSCQFERNNWRCSQCQPGYVLTRNKRICACPAGSYSSVSGCLPCTKDFYCPWLNNNPIRCPGVLLTAAPGAHSIGGCVNPPGYRYVNNPKHPTAIACGANEYSLGLARQPTCSPCPPQTATDPENVLGTHTSSAICMAKPGFYQLNDGTVVPCPVGYFKTGYTGRGQECTSCAAAGRSGFTTDGEGKTSVQDCRVVPPGYTAVVRGVVQSSRLTAIPTHDFTSRLCPHDHYCPGGDPTAEGQGYAQLCSADLTARTALRTFSTGAVSADACVAPPGFAFVGGAAVECGNGYYKATWDRSSSCTPCGSNLATSEDPADTSIGWKSDKLTRVAIRDPNNGLVRTTMLTRGHPDTCYIRRGMGALMTSTGSLTAVACTNGFYGTPLVKRYGVRLYMCLECPTKQVTSCPVGGSTCQSDLEQYSQTYTAAGVTAFFDKRACRHQAGYGWVTAAWSSTASGPRDVSLVAALECLQGYYSAGGSNSSCTQCPFGLLTADEGSDDVTDCVAPPGYRYIDRTATPASATCSDGYYSDDYSTSTTCTPCGNTAPASGTYLWRSVQKTALTWPNAATGIPSIIFVRGTEDTCYLSPGLGTAPGGSAGNYEAVVCNSNNYGNSSVLYSGAVAHPCSECAPGILVTACTGVVEPYLSTCQAALAANRNAGTGGYTSSDACRYKPGYGLVTGVLSECPGGYYSPGGGDQSTPCTICPLGSYCPAGSPGPVSCPDSLATLTAGADSADDCV